MNLIKTIVAAALTVAGPLAALAAPTADEIKQLGTSLTPWGAEKAGNKESTIPEYTGGLTHPPANFDKQRQGWRPDPFPNDKPLHRIDAKNMGQYADKLSPGTKELMKKYPTFYIDVYPTRRTVTYPQQVIDNTLKNASRCAIINNGLGIDVSKGCRGGIPFPIPKSGMEVVWNHHLRYAGLGSLSKQTSHYVKPNGDDVISGVQYQYNEYGFYDNRKKVPDQFALLRAEYIAPTRIAGQTSFLFDSIVNSERRSWSYQPATRRTRLAPDLAADTPIASTGGAKLYDEGYQFTGKIDLWDWKLVGKEELLIPYNIYKLEYPEKGGGCTKEEGLLTAFHVKPSCVRWELHRVWHVTATLKPGKRHVYSKRDFFFDEDAWHGGLQENYDQAGKLYRVHLHGLTPAYERAEPGLAGEISMDLITGIYQIWTADAWYVTWGPLTPEQATPESTSAQILKY